MSKLTLVHHPSSQCDVCHIKGQRVEFNLLNEHIFSVYIIVACSHAHTPAEALFFVSINSMIFFICMCLIEGIFCM